MRTAKFKAAERELRRSPFLYFNLRDLFEDLIKDCESYKKQRDELIEDIAKLCEENTELIIRNARVIKRNAELERKINELERRE